MKVGKLLKSISLSVKLSVMPWLRLFNSKRIRLERRFSSSKFSRAKLIKTVSVVCFFGLLAAIFSAAIMFAWAAKDLPSPDKIVRREGFATKIYDRNDKLLYDVYDQQKRIPVTISEVPTYLKEATVAIEDKNFYTHKGFDPLGFARIFYNIIIRRQLTGGSTLTQQLVKNVLLTSQRTITRKAKEFILAVQIENKYTKDEILQMYLNEAPYGGTAWGVEAGAETYFGKKAAELNLVESAILAGLPQSPTYYSPYGTQPQAYVGRAKDVLRRMREDGYISAEDEKKADSELPDVKFEGGGGDFEAPHFVMYVKQLLEERYGQSVVEGGGLKVKTSLDLDIQKKAQDYVTDEIKKVEPLHITNGGAVVINPQTGEILAMVGSKNYNDPDYDGKVNVTLSLRQPGSSIKPVTYATAFSKGYSPATAIADVSTEFPGGISAKPYVPVNYDGKDHGLVDLRTALGSSLNVPAVKLLAMVGIKEMLGTAYKMGLSTLEPTKENISNFGLSVTLGGGEVKLIDMAGAYSAFANGGYKIDPISILKVEDSKGKVLDEYKPQKGARILPENVTYLINSVLSDNNARLLTFGENSLLNVSGQTVAVKTGTTDDKRDNWAIGWTPKFLVGVWVGNNDNTAMKQVASGVSGASPIWRDIVNYMLGKTPGSEFSMPDTVKKIAVDKISGYPSHDGFETKDELFLQGAEPTGEDPIHKNIKVCKGQKDKLASVTMVAKGDFDQREVIDIREDDPVSTDGVNRWQDGINKWLAKQSDERYKIPGEYCGQSNDVVVNWRSPSDKQEVDSNSFDLEVEAVSNNAIDKVEIYVDGNIQGTFTQKPYKTSVSLTDGKHTLKAKAYDNRGTTGESEINIGVNKPWDFAASPSPSPSPSPVPSPSS